MINLKDIITTYVHPPVPSRCCDWSAHMVGDEEDGPFGFGSTESEAVNNLIEQLGDTNESEPKLVEGVKNV